jgi:hypothetical protein
MKVSVISLALLGILSGCASSENSAGDEPPPSGDGDGDGPSLDGLDLDEGETIAAENLIDDLEDKDDSIKEQDGRQGSWYTFNDEGKGGEQSPPPDKFAVTPASGDNMSKYVAGTKGKGYKEYAGLAVDLNSDGDKASPYDASKFKGISFIARGVSGSKELDLRFGVSTPATIAEGDGGECTGGDAKCDDSFGADITVDGTWQKFDIPFSLLAQEGWGDKATFDAKKIVGFTFSVPEGGAEFDFAIDNVGFY